MISYMFLFLFIGAEYITATCDIGIRNDPVMIIRGLNKNHKLQNYYLYYLPNQEKECKVNAKRWNNYKTDFLCACKEIQNYNTKNKILLRCITRKASHVYSRRIAVYYFDNLKNECLIKARYLEKMYE